MTEPAGWEAVIGMEVHVQLSTRTKMFCGCSSDYLAAAPNANVCEVCLGMPGTLPVINRVAVAKLVTTALAFGCEILPFSKFDRKNYFYPDLPKGYQISQYDLPLSRSGRLQVGGRSIRITRVHLEEDTGKLVHAGEHFHAADESYVDLNRAGVPLMEIVTEPDLSSAAEAQAYAVALRSILRHIGASDADMERGQLRAEANVSVRRVGDPELGVKTELKNINSFRFLMRAIDFEIERQVADLEAGRAVVQETRGWSEAQQRTFSQRSKEQAQDYRYFPEPDLPPLELAPSWIEELRAALPELPMARGARFQDQFGLNLYDASLLVEEREVADYYEEVMAEGADSKIAANWMIGDIMPRWDVAKRPSARHLADLFGALARKTINRDQGRQALEWSLSVGRPPMEAVMELGLSQLSDQDLLAKMVEEVLTANPKAVADYRGGKQQALGALMGQIKARSGGSANMDLVRNLLHEQLD